MDSSLVACRVHRELGMNVLPHMTCRDRNLNATKALLLGLYAEGVREVLAITGDPIPTAERDEVKNVYQFNSRKLAQYIVSLAGEGREMPAPITVFGALNLNARNFEVELRRAAEKLENGMSGFLTQPVLSAQAVENLKKARETLGERQKFWPASCRWSASATPSLWKTRSTASMWMMPSSKGLRGWTVPQARSLDWKSRCRQPKRLRPMQTAFT